MRERQPLIVHVLHGLRFGGNENLCLQLIKNAPPQFRHALINTDPLRVEMKDVFLSCPDLVLIDRAYARTARIPFVVNIARDLKRIGADGLIIYPFGLHVLVAMSARAVGIRHIVAHAGNPPPLDPKRRRLWKRIVVASRILQVPIKSCSAMVHRELGALSARLPAGSEALPNGVDADAIEKDAAGERARKVIGGPRVVGMAARFNVIKDHDTLLKAFALVQERVEHSELWLIGDGERRPALVALAGQLKITDKVRFWGERSDVHRLLGGMDVFVFSTTRDEGFGIALAEAMAARTPIVASDVQACREVLLDGVAGKLVPPRNAEQLADAITELLINPDIARPLTDQAYVRVQRDFNVKQCAQRYYDSVSRGTRDAKSGTAKSRDDAKLD